MTASRIEALPQSLIHQADKPLAGHFIQTQNLVQRGQCRRNLERLELSSVQRRKERLPPPRVAGVVDAADVLADESEG